MSNAPASTAARSLVTAETPCLVLDEGRMLNNIARLRRRLAPFAVTLRPHLKTAKSIEVARAVMDGPGGPACVSTLREAEVFADAGVTDILYAVGIAPQKLARVSALRQRGVDLCVILDSLDQAKAIAEAARAPGDRIPALIEIDCDSHRAGVRPDDPSLVEIGRTLHEGGAELRGVMAHAGESYSCRSVAALEAAAEQERAITVSCAETLRSAGLPCPVVSVGSTPTAHFARRLDGVTEVRAGVFVMFDLVMAGIGVCTLDDIALSVLATVIGQRADRGWSFVDAGWMALSRDRGTARQAVDQGYGVVCDVDGKPYLDLIVTDANQEHGIITRRPGSSAPPTVLPIGTQVRILPNHACATGAQHDRYHVVRDGSEIVRQWERFRGW